MVKTRKASRTAVINSEKFPADTVIAPRNTEKHTMAIAMESKPHGDNS
jgi:hypothetical protein